MEIDGDPDDRRLLFSKLGGGRFEAGRESLGSRTCERSVADDDEGHENTFRRRDFAQVDRPEEACAAWFIGTERSARIAISLDAPAEYVRNPGERRAHHLAVRDVDHEMAAPFGVQSDFSAGADDELCTRSVLRAGFGRGDRFRVRKFERAVSTEGFDDTSALVR